MCLNLTGDQERLLISQAQKQVDDGVSKIHPILPNQPLINKIKSECALRNTTLTALCKQHNLDSSNVIKALRGTWTGDTATSVCQLIANELSIDLSTYNDALLENECDNCGGTGSIRRWSDGIPEQQCEICNGSGFIKEAL